MKEKLICITTPSDRTYYAATVVAKEFLDKEQNVVNTMGTLPNGKITEINTATVTIKHLLNGQLNGNLQIINLADGSVSLNEEYKNGKLISVSGQDAMEDELKTKAIPLHQGTIVKTTKTTRSFYSNGKEVAEETIAANGSSVEILGHIPDGEVKEFDEAGNLLMQASYSNNKLNGEFIQFAPNGAILSKETYVNGMLNGPAEYYTYTKQDKWIAKCTYRNARLSGERTLTQANGAVRKREHYHNGHLDGVQTAFYPNGQKEWEETFTAGKRNGKRELYFPDGKIWYREYYKDDRLNGPRVGYFKNGKPFLEELYADNLLEGKRTIYDEEGNLISNEDYHWGALVKDTERSAK